MHMYVMKNKNNFIRIDYPSSNKASDFRGVQSSLAKSPKEKKEYYIGWL